MSAVLHAIGTATPPRAVSQDDAAAMASKLMELPARRARALATLFAQAGVDTRRMVAGADGAELLEPRRRVGCAGPTTGVRVGWYNTHAPDLAEQACLETLTRAAIEPARVTHLVTVSCTGFEAPGVDIELIRRLALPATVQRTHVGFMGCHGALNGLRVAAAIVGADPDAVVLVCCVELCSIHLQYDAENGAATSSALFGDGAAACLVSGRGPGPSLTRFGSILIDGTLDDMGWRIGDHGFRMSLSARVPRLLREHVGPWVDAWLAGAGMRRADVGSWAIHPGGPRILEAASASLGLSERAVAEARTLLRTHGNMSSPTVLFIIRRLLETNAALPIVALAFGPGLAGEALLIESTEPRREHAS